MNSAQVFISYSSADRTFADRLQSDLVNIGLSVWKDDKDIKPGDSFSGRIEQAVITSDFFLIILSTSSISSPWVEREYRLALNSQLEKSKPCIIPILLYDVEL